MAQTSIQEDGDCGSVGYLAKPDVFDAGPSRPALRIVSMKDD